MMSANASSLSSINKTAEKKALVPYFVQGLCFSRASSSLRDVCENLENQNFETVARVLKPCTTAASLAERRKERFPTRLLPSSLCDPRRPIPELCDAGRELQNTFAFG